MFSHERVVVRRGPESGLPIIVAIHSTARGQAIGGCRMATYPDWRDGLADALRLSAAMTTKCALAGLPNGGGKTVIALPPAPAAVDPVGPDGSVGADGSVGSVGPVGVPGSVGPELRRAALHDVGVVIAELGGAYATGPDVGTGPDDMVTIGERTEHVFCRPVERGGSGDSSPATAIGTIAALRAICTELFGSPDLSGHSFAVLGLGRVGGHVARLLAAAGARLVVSDIDPARRSVATDLDAAWTSPGECLRADVDVLVPAAMGGLLTPASVPTLHCRAIAGPANNQLDAPPTATLLHDRGILWAPDQVVSAGGIIHATGVELRHESEAEALARVESIGDTLATLLRTATAEGRPPAEIAARLP
ncbi:Glu/Leu/Phe/Val dehydrogenase dimerization domain-containing protein [Paractinoplanes toevensis]|uniref:Leucine dehydrogenase n=1 Tax=Paractinoplanes toevensis TaxID=571911 RepID=A0A919WC36_9ACTN|nr:Glu/Leu/Phe/Val dehydrogenase dimerization domain-containing protein [Actinoplanes toevensis]GIM97431.1 leucine dehydrogenase [Actinoplanes toevensis]